jgi:Fe-S oxidoreductase
LCTACGGCTEVCPARIKTKNGILTERKCAYETKKGVTPEHSAVISSVKNYDNPWGTPRRQKAKWADGLPREGDVLLFAGCSTSLLFPENAKRAVRLMRLAGVSPAYLGEKERCCGSTARKLGDEKLAREKLEGCMSDFRNAGAKLVITTCPGCASALNRDSELLERAGIRVEHISQFLSKRLDSLKLRDLRLRTKATYHDPCDLGRELGEYDAPRKILSAALGDSFVEMERSGRNSSCCGAGAGVKSAFPELASAIAEDRVAMAKAAGADTIVTACPWCQQSLQEASRSEPKLSVVDITEIVERSMG